MIHSHPQRAVKIAFMFYGMIQFVKFLITTKVIFMEWCQRKSADLIIWLSEFFQCQWSTFPSWIIMEDSIDIILQDKKLHHAYDKPIFMAASGAMLMASYGLWTVFALPGFRKVPTSLKVPFLPSSRVQTHNIMKLLQGRRGCLADLGSGDGRLVFAASSLGFQCTGFEINSILIGYARARARWMGLPNSAARFVNEDFWKTDLSRYKNLTVFLAPGVMEVLGRKLEQELDHDARVIACRFPFPHWHASASEGEGLDQAWAYDMATVRRLP